MVQKAWIFHIHTDVLSSMTHYLCSENDRCYGKHVAQPHRSGDKVIKAGSSWIYKIILGRRNAEQKMIQFGSNRGLNTLKPPSWHVPQPLNDLMQKWMLCSHKNKDCGAVFLLCTLLDFCIRDLHKLAYSIKKPYLANARMFLSWSLLNLPLLSASDLQEITGE